jgi:hypothetical protein
MIDSVTSSTAGAALGIRQGLNQAEFSAKALGQTAEQQQQAVTTLLQGAGGGNTTETRGQNLNIVV